LAQSVQPVLNVPIWLMAVILGICASASSTVSSADYTSPDSVAARIADLDDVLPIVLGGFALAAIRELSPASVTWLTLQCIGL
jgi:ribose/xylose/arabinose/galactoside ABC-type transport system permease subunit